MRIDVVTLFPEMLRGPLGLSIVGRAQGKGALKLGFIDPRDFAPDRHRTVDDRPFGGGPGMVLMAEPLAKAVESVRRRGSFVAYLSPQGRRLDQRMVRRLAKERHLVLVCGHYEGVDERFLKDVDMEVSVGDFVLTGGEIPAMAVVDAVARLLPGVLSDPGSALDETFAEGPSGEFRGLEYPHFTRPRVWRRRKVPEVLLSGDHDRIARWRAETARRRTLKKRPDLLSRSGT